MRLFRVGTRLSAALAALLVLGGSAIPAAAQDQAEVHGPLEVGQPGESVVDMMKLMAPMGDLISGPTWMTARGYDPTPFLSRPGTDAFLGRLQHLEVGSPVLQAPGGGAPGIVPYRDPSPKFSRNVLVTRDYSRAPIQTEPHMAVNPRDPDHVVLGVIDYNFPSVTSYVTFDGGATWEGPQQVPYPREHRISAGDPVVAFDSGGNVYYNSISLDVEEWSVGPVFGQAVVSHIKIARSDDGGLAWGTPLITDQRRRVTAQILPGGTPDRPRASIRFNFLDKPWMTVGPDPGDPDRDIIYVTYTLFSTSWRLGWVGDLAILTSPEVETVIEMVRSVDGGASWDEPVEISPRVRRTFAAGDGDGNGDAPAHAVGVHRTVQGSQPAVAPDGTLYITWMDTTDDGAFEGMAEVHVARSDDGGQTFQPSRRAALFLELPFRPRNAFFRYWGSAFPQLAVGPEGNVYVAFTAVPSRNPEDDGDILFVRSTDRGQTWDRPRTLNDDGSGRVQFFPSIDVAPDGTIHAMWGDMRDDPKETEYHIYYTSSSDGGETWEQNTRVTDAPSNPNYGFPNGLFIGDYFSIKATEQDVYMVWADTRLGEFTTFNQKIGFARQRLLPQPEFFISPPRGPGGQDVTIQAFNFQPGQQVFVQVGDSIVATARTTEDGRLTSRLFFPVAGQGSHEVRIVDASGNVATGSFFMDFGFGDIQQATAPIRELAERTTALEQQLAGGGSGGGGMSVVTATMSVGWAALGLAALGVVALLALRWTGMIHRFGAGSPGASVDYTTRQE